MCRIYNTVGSLTTLKSHLVKRNIHDFKSLKQIVDFKNSFPVIRQQIITQHQQQIEQEKITLKTTLKELENVIEIKKQEAEQRLRDEINTLELQLSSLSRITATNFFQELTINLRKWIYRRKIIHKEGNFYNEVKKSTKYLEEDYQVKNNRYKFITSHFEEAVRESTRHTLSELERKKAILEELSNFIYGAVGEQQVVNLLQALSDDYHLINDFAVSFSPAIFNRQENDYIKSVQVDHILIGPCGVFLIETKNWGEKSLENLNLRSPVHQIKRASFVLFKLLNNEISNHHLHLDKHHWGEKKISIRNLIVLTNTKPKEEFQYVKILTLNELLRYINYFKSIYSTNETQKIVDFILRINEQKIVKTK